MCFPLRYDCHELRPRLERRNVTMGPHRREDKVGSPSPLLFGNVVCRTAVSVGTGSYLLITTLFGFPGEKKVKSLSPVRLFAILEWVAISFSRRPSRPRDRTRVSCIAGRCFTIWATREASGKEAACQRDTGSILGWGRSPGGGHGTPLQSSCLENVHGQRSLAGYSPWGCKESDRTEQLSMLAHSLPARQHARICTSSPCLGEF